MKFKGSKTVFINCLECSDNSPYFRVYLAEEDGEICYYDTKIPGGWKIEEEAELWDDSSLDGYCPKHKPEGA